MAKKSPGLSGRAEKIMQARAWTRESSDGSVPELLTCPRCNGELLINQEHFKRATKGSIMLPCIYCGAYSRKPGMTAMKVQAILKRSKA